MTTYSWDPAVYARNARYVAELADDVFALLDPRPGERVLDLGCGDGVVSERLHRLGCRVTGVDSSPEMVAVARARGVDARLGDAERLEFDAEFDAVFSNQVLHWVHGLDALFAGVRRALVDRGRFVAECGAEGCIATILAAIYDALAPRRIDGAALNPWRFPAVDDFTARLRAHGFELVSLALTPRRTRLDGDLRGWLATFGGTFLAALPPADHRRFVDEVEQALAPQLRAEDGSWAADYVLLRFAAVKRPA